MPKATNLLAFASLCVKICPTRCLSSGLSTQWNLINILTATKLLLPIVANLDYIGPQDQVSLFSRSLRSKSVVPRTGVSGRVVIDLLSFTTTREEVGQVIRPM